MNNAFVYSFFLYFNFLQVVFLLYSFFLCFLEKKRTFLDILTDWPSVSLLHSGLRPLCTCTEWEAVDHRWTPKLGISQESAADRMGALSRLWMRTCFISASGIEFLCPLLLVAPLCFSNQPWWFKMAWCSQWAGFFERHTFYFFPITFTDIIG